MGCGLSKYKFRNKISTKKTETQEKVTESDEGGLAVESDSETPECLDDLKKTVKIKPFGGPLLAQTEISSSQQDFFKMLDDKIENGPDYNSESETEKAAEAARLSALLKDWETASVGSRSLPATPKRRPKMPMAVRCSDGVRGASAEVAVREMPRPPPDRAAYVSQIPQSVIHQSYGVTQVSYRQVNYNNPNYISQSPAHHQIASYPSALQYQAISPMYSTPQPPYQPPPPRQYPSYNQHGSPIRTYVVNTSPKHIPSYEQPVVTPPGYNSPSHKLYGPQVVVNKPMYSNGELVQQQQQQQQQQQMYNHHHHQMQYQQYKEAREQVLTQHQLQQPAPPPPYARSTPRNYQSSVTIPIVRNQHQHQMSDMNSLHRKQYELT